MKIIRQEKDSDGNVIYEQHDDGYYEYNTYENGRCIRSECHYSNGLVEVEQYKKD